MAHTVQNPVAGRMVYQVGSPCRAGKIMGVKFNGGMQGYMAQFVRVKWLDGSETTVNAHGLRDLVALHDETAKKLATHKKTIARVQAL